MKKNLLALGSLATLTLFYVNCTGFSVGVNDSSTSSSVSEDQIMFERGSTLYAQNCASCHGGFDASLKKKTSLSALKTAILQINDMKVLQTLPLQSLEEISFALNYSPGNINDGALNFGPWTSLSERSCTPETIARDLQILDRNQYHNMIQDVFGYDVDVSALPDRVHDYYTPEALSSGSGISDLLEIETYYTLAQQTASYLDSNFSSVTTRFSACTQTSRACQDEIATAAMSLLFRQKLDSSDSDYVAITNQFSAVGDFKTRFKNIVVASLMMPRVLYAAEYKKDFRSTALKAGVSRSLTDRELASRLALMIWNSVPDKTLLDLAAKNTLSQPSILKAQIDRLLTDAKSKRFTTKFTNDWLGIGNLETSTKDASIYPTSSAPLMTKMKTETQMFVRNFFDQNRDVRQLFTDDKTFVDSQLATHYGFSGVISSAFVSVARPQASLAAGLLAQGSLAAIASTDTTDPIVRGIYNYRRLLCGDIPNPPADAGLVVFDGSKFEQMQGRISDARCLGCHQKFEPMGFTFETLNPLGQLRAVDEVGATIGQPVRLPSNAQVSTPAEMGAEFSKDPMIGYCLSQNLTKFALTSSYQPTSAMKCQTQNVMVEAFKKGNGFRSYIEAVIQSPAFTRKLETP